ncbi:hypothetical protein JW711_05705 [Candidatus Woesearchaeota archaeon]|nr:hypothetical protein [Candidatus Woesearchaeota archaeon]
MGRMALGALLMIAFLLYGCSEAVPSGDFSGMNGSVDEPVLDSGGIDSENLSGVAISGEGPVEISAILPCAGLEGPPRYDCLKEYGSAAGLESCGVFEDPADLAMCESGVVGFDS